MRQALELALEALEDYVEEYGPHEKDSGAAYAITAIKEALAQPEQEPVKMVAYNCTCGKTMKFESLHGVVAPQRTWVGLTDEEVASFDVHAIVDAECVRAIEAKLKEKNCD